MTVAQDYAAFDPKTYLQEYYATLFPENIDLLRFLTDSFRAIQPHGRVLDFGCGPTLFTSLIAAAYPCEIHVSDWNAANRAEITEWLEQTPTAFDWRPTIRTILEFEGQTATLDQIATREAAARQQISRVLPCDALSATPLGTGAQQYDLVVSSMCLEAAASDTEEWRQCVRNLATLIKPGGALLLIAVKRARSYSVGDAVFGVVPISETDLHTALNATGFLGDSISIEWTPADHPVHPYDGLLFTSATKAADPARG